MITLSDNQKAIIQFIKDWKKHNEKKFGIGLVTQAEIMYKFGISKQRADQIGIALQNKGILSRNRGRASNFWELT